MKEIGAFKGIIKKEDFVNYKYAWTFYKKKIREAIQIEIYVLSVCNTNVIVYRVKWRKPIKSTVGDLTIYTAPPPGSGALVTFIMNVLYGIIPNQDNRITWQNIIETFKWTYAKRTKLADPDFVNISESAIYVIIAYSLLFVISIHITNKKQFFISYVINHLNINLNYFR